MKKRVLMIAGGTGGHIFPALAVARELQQKGHEVHWLGSMVGMERDLVGDEFPITFVSVKAVRGKSLLTKFKAMANVLLATWQSLRFIRRFQPHLVIGMGGFVSGPGGVAARILRKPLLIHEQNAVPGMTNRLLSHIAQRTLEGFPNTFQKQAKATITGNPVRPEIFTVHHTKQSRYETNESLNMLVLGGSRGATVINDTVVQVIQQLPAGFPMRVWHQTGKNDYDRIQSSYQSASLDARIAPFIEDISAAYAWADVVLCRSGALTVAELAASGSASILVPYPYAVDDHQYKNARFLAKSGAAEIIRETDFSAKRLHDLLVSYQKDRSKLFEMAQAAQRLGNPTALSAIVAVCEELIKDDVCEKSIDDSWS